MALEHEPDVHSGELVVAVRLQANEFDARTQCGEVDGERRRRLLPPQRGFEFRVRAVDADAIARPIRRREERESHDVVPVHVGHEDMERLRRGGTVTGDDALAERTHAGSQVAEDEIRTAGDDLDAGTVAAEGAGHGKTQAVHVGLKFGVRGERCARPRRAMRRSPSPGRRTR